MNTDRRVENDPAPCQYPEKPDPKGCAAVHGPVYVVDPRFSPIHSVPTNCAAAFVSGVRMVVGAAAPFPAKMYRMSSVFS